MFQVFLVAVIIVVSSTFTVFALTRPWVGHVLVSHGAYQTAVAVDSTGAFHVIIADSSLLYSTTAGGGWTTTVLDGDHSVFRAVLARDTKDHLHVVEEAYPHRTGPPGDVAMASIRYWTNSPGGWSATTIDAGRGASIAIDGSNHIHVAYLRTNGSALELRHASNAAGSWASAPVLRWLEWAPSEAGGASAVAVSPSGTVHITLSYEGSLRYVTNESGSWVESELTPSFNDALEGSAPIAVDTAGRVHTAFAVYNSSTNLTTVIHATNSNGNWSWDSIGTARAGITCSMILDSRGDVHLSYADSSTGEPTAGVLTYAVSVDGHWSKQVVDPNTRSPAGNSIALDPSGNPVISYEHWEFSQILHYPPDWVRSIRVVSNIVASWNFGDLLALLAPYFLVELVVLAVAFRVAARRLPKTRRGLANP